MLVFFYGWDQTRQVFHADTSVLSRSIRLFVDANDHKWDKRWMPCIIDNLLDDIDSKWWTLIDGQCWVIYHRQRKKEKKKSWEALLTMNGRISPSDNDDDAENSKNKTIILSITNIRIHCHINNDWDFLLCLRVRRERAISARSLSLSLSRSSYFLSLTIGIATSAERTGVLE